VDDGTNSTLRQAIRAKNAAYQRLDNAYRACYERRYRTRTRWGYGDLPVSWEIRLAELEGDYQRALERVRVVSEVRRACAARAGVGGLDAFDSTDIESFRWNGDGNQNIRNLKWQARETKKADL
jgi:hypothetical protein